MNIGKMNNPLSRANAIRLLNKYDIRKPEEINLEEIAENEFIDITFSNLPEVYGKIVFNNEVAAITISDNLNLQTQIKFTIAHEMGHFFNERNNTGFNKIFYRCGYEQLYGKDKYLVMEANANAFASELLMPQEWFIKFSGNNNFSVNHLKYISEYFKVSFLSAVIRYSEIGKEPIAVILVKDSIVQWSCINKNFPHKFIRNKIKVNKDSYVFDYFEGKSIPSDGEDIPKSAWFYEDHSFRNYNERIFEIIIPYPNYKSALVVLKEI